MINYTEVKNFEEQIRPGKVYRYEIAIEIPLTNIENLDRMIDYFSGRLRQKLDLQSLRTEKIRILEGEPSEIFIYFSLNGSETRSLWTVWKKIDAELVPIGTSKLLSVFTQAFELPANIGQPEGLLAQIKQFFDDYGVLLELVLLIVIICILLSEKQE